MTWNVDPLPDRFVPGAVVTVVEEGPGFVVVRKPAGLLTVPGRGPERADCVERQVRGLFPQAEVVTAVHRLDLETSGLLVVAIERSAVTWLTRAFEERAVRKVYEAVLVGEPPGEEGEIRAPIGPAVRPRFAVAVGGRAAVTRWWRIGERRVRFAPTTGRTHQLRLHAAYPVEDPLGVGSGGLGSPIVGDSLYGDAGGDRLLLHASRLELPGFAAWSWEPEF